MRPVGNVPRKAEGNRGTAPEGNELGTAVVVRANYTSVLTGTPSGAMRKAGFTTLRRALRLSVVIAVPRRPAAMLRCNHPVDQSAAAARAAILQRQLLQVGVRLVPTRIFLLMRMSSPQRSLICGLGARIRPPNGRDLRMALISFPLPPDPEGVAFRQHAAGHERVAHLTRPLATNYTCNHPSGVGHRTPPGS